MENCEHRDNEKNRVTREKYDVTMHYGIAQLQTWFENRAQCYVF